MKFAHQFAIFFHLCALCLYAFAWAAAGPHWLLFAAGAWSVLFGGYSTWRLRRGG